MNLILFEPTEIDRPLPRTDRRAVHLLDVLRRHTGDSFDAGIVNGPRGKATLTQLAADALTFSFTPTTPVAPPAPITLLVGLPRPQTARDILRDATTLGVGALHFVRTEKAESSYAQSTLWSSGEWRRHVLAGAEQAFVTRIPEVTHGHPLATTLTSFAPLTSPPSPPPIPSFRLALDNYESPSPLGQLALSSASTASIVLALGAERGWSAAERDLLRAHHFTFVHLGERVLRTETAVTAALAIVRAKLGLM